MAECPKCGADLTNPKSCGACGWKPRTRKELAEAKDAPPEHIPCAYMACDVSAIIRERMPTGWASLCLQHYEAHYRDQAEKRMVELGLYRQPDEAHDQHRKRVMGYIQEKLRTSRALPFNADDEEDRWSASA